MKIKFLSCVLAVALLLILLASCIPDNPPIELSSSDTTCVTTAYEGTTYPLATVPTITAYSDETTTFFQEVVPPYIGPPGDYASYKSGHGCLDMDDMVIFNYMGEIQYYDRHTRTFRRFCFDSSCNHQNWQECISLRFIMANVYGAQTIQYSEYDGRFYSLRGSRLYSFANDGSDLVLECSIGSEGALDQYIYNSTRTTNLSIVDHYAYMISIDDQSRRHLWRFDLETNRLREVKYMDSRYQILACRAIDSELYVLVNDGVNGIYKIQYSPSGEVVFCGTDFVDADFIKESFCRNGKIYYMKDYNTLFVYDPKTREECMLYEYNEKGRIEFHMVTDSYAYFSVTPTTNDSEAKRGDVYRVDLFTGEATLAFRFHDHIYYDGNTITVYDLHFLSENKVMICVPFSGVRQTSGQRESFTSVGVVVTVNEDGDFINPQIIEISE